MEFKKLIRDVRDFPKPGILFRDITPLLGDGEFYRAAIDELADTVRNWNAEIIVGPEARGYVVGAPLSYALGVGFAPVRKKGKLPAQTVSITYDLEYGQDTLEIHRDAILPGQRVVVADDLLATGGTIHATKELVEKLGGIVVGAAFFIELTELQGRSKLAGVPIRTLVTY
jgi:adenine phosphoribosyltransferase